MPVAAIKINFFKNKTYKAVNNKQKRPPAVQTFVFL